MKMKLLMAGLLGLVSATAFAQKGELNNAKDEYEKYETMRGQKAMAAMATTSINNAKTSIDKASANEKTSAMPLTFALKGAIYSSLAVKDTIPATAAPLFATAEEAIKKAKELDTKGDNKVMIQSASTNLAQYKLNEGVKEFQNKAYDQAYSSFDYYRTVLPDDTNAIYYTALAAANAGSKDPKYYGYAITNYNKLVTTNYSGNAKVYYDMSTLYLMQKDTANSLKAADAGVAKYPSNTDLRRRDIEIALQTGKQSDVLAKIQAAIAADPKNKTLYYYEGITYSQVADAADGSADKAKDAASKTTLHQTALDNYSKAADLYKKALEIDPNYFDANLNLGYVLIRPAIDAYNAANKLPASQQKQYDAAIAKSMDQFNVAKPYLLKAVDINPKSVDALTNLLSYYKATKDNANAAKTKAQIDALK